TLATCGLSLFPQAGDLATTCSCPDHANPCKHVAAVHYVLAQTFDGDPFLLPALRGRGRDGLLAALRSVRRGGLPAPDEPDDRPAPGGVLLTDLHAMRLYEARSDLAAIAVHPVPPTDPGASLRRLGPPPIGDDGTADALHAAIERAADRAWRLAAGDDGFGDLPDSGGDAGTVLAELRRRGSATTRDVADAVGRSPEQVRALLRSLVAAGLVDRTGHARGTRYHAL
ncbi:MAG TPA: FaeA/PapI family transcriptional regulator, partial [Acidimicrobiales bacterium]